MTASLIGQLLGPILISGLTFAILYPDDPAERGARVRRTLLTVAAYALVFDIAATLVEAPVSRWVTYAAAPVLILRLVELAIVPFSIAERLAGLAHPRRTRGWAAIGVAGGLGWSGLFYLLLWRAPDPPPAWPAVAFIHVVPGLVAGLVWHALLPSPDRKVGEVFE